MAFERHPASVVDEAGILYIDRENKKKTLNPSEESGF